MFLERFKPATDSLKCISTYGNSITFLSSLIFNLTFSWIMIKTQGLMPASQNVESHACPFCIFLIKILLSFIMHNALSVITLWAQIISTWLKDAARFTKQLTIINHLLLFKFSFLLSRVWGTVKSFFWMLFKQFKYTGHAYDQVKLTCAGAMGKIECRI